MQQLCHYRMIAPRCFYRHNNYLQYPKKYFYIWEISDRYLIYVFPLMKKIFKITSLTLLLFIAIIAGAGIYLNTALPDVAAAPDIHIEQTPERIERGRYLANHVAVCMDCHSTRDWSLFSGPLAAGGFGGGGEIFDRNMGFPGVFYARNITPAALKDWTDGEILRAVTAGVRKNGEALFPVMPYQHYGHMDHEDIYAIIAYIRTLAPVASTLPSREIDFPVSLLINTMPENPSFQKRPSESDRINYGRYLVNAASCVDCHSRQEKGRIIPGSEFGGGMEFRMPAGIVRSPNITPHMENGIGNWTRPGFVQRFRMYLDSSYQSDTYTAADLNTPMPWTMYAGMSESDLEAIYDYLQSLPAIDHEVVRYEKVMANAGGTSAR